MNADLNYLDTEYGRNKMIESYDWEAKVNEMKYIEHRLRASIKYDAINGDENEKSVLIRQIEEAIQTIVSLRIELAKVKNEGSPMILS